MATDEQGDVNIPAVAPAGQHGGWTQVPVPQMQMPPGFVPTEMQQFMTWMAQQQQYQFEQFMNTYAAQRPPERNTGGAFSQQAKLDERWFRRLEKSTNKKDDWKEWRMHLLTNIGWKV